MLVLTRKHNESIVLDGNIVVTVLEVRGNRVRLGITAPREIPIQREELIGSTPGHSDYRALAGRCEPACA
jgi:carbon storage regulator